MSSFLQSMMISIRNTILLYISQKSYFSEVLYFYSENSLSGYTVLVSLKNILIAEILKDTTIYLVGISKSVMKF